MDEEGVEVPACEGEGTERERKRKKEREGGEMERGENESADLRVRGLRGSGLQGRGGLVVGWGGVGRGGAGRGCGGVRGLMIPCSLYFLIPAQTLTTLSFIVLKHFHSCGRALSLMRIPSPKRRARNEMALEGYRTDFTIDFRCLQAFAACRIIRGIPHRLVRGIPHRSTFAAYRLSLPAESFLEQL